MNRVNPNDLEILVGTAKLSAGGKRYKVKNVIKHDKYISPGYGDGRAHGQMSFDIAAVQVNGPIQFNDKVQPIKYSAQELGDGENLQVSGWGILKVILLLFVQELNRY